MPRRMPDPSRVPDYFIDVDLCFCDVAEQHIDVATQHIHGLIGYDYDYDYDSITMEKIMERTREEMDIMYSEGVW